MIISRYCKVFTDADNTDSVVLFSTKMASMITIPKSMVDDIGQDKLSEEERGTLTRLGLLVNSQDEERLEILGFLDDVNASYKVFSAHLVMNLDCNLNCGYCFEGSRKGKLYMTKETAGAFVEFVRSAVGPDIQEIKITLYGGEPLLSQAMIMAVSNDINSFTQERGIKYTAMLITNGTLLTPQAVKTLEPSGVKIASVTLDGPEDVHDSSRPFKNGKGSFRIIIKNLKEVRGMISIDIGGNYTKRNYRRFPALLDGLMDEGLTPERVSSVHFYPVIQEVKGIVNRDFNDGCNSIKEPWIFEAEIFLREEVLKRGYKTSRIIPATCLMELKNRFVVNYDGTLFKCAGLIGREDFKIGDLKTGIKDYSSTHNLNNWKNDECLNCEYLPLCFGGCRYMKFVREGNMEGVDCKKKYLDATLEKAVMQDIKYGLAGK